MRQSWTDDRLDDRFDHLEAEMNQRFERVEGEMKAGFERVDGEMKAGFERVDGEIKEVRGEIKEVRAEMKEGNHRLLVRFDQYDEARRAESNALQRTLLLVLGTFGGALVGLIGVVVAQLQ